MKTFKEFQEAKVITESDAYEKSEENKRSADAAKKQGDMFAHHLHMADYHDNLAQWHAEKGRHGVADNHAEKSEEHHKKAMALKEEAKHINELSSGLLQRYKDKAMKQVDKLNSAGQHAKANSRLMAHMKATGKQIEKTTADIKKALR